MKTILTPKEMKEADRYAIRRLRIPSLRLMERAGMAVVKEAVALADNDAMRSFGAVIFCGKGNNGGDGFVAARRLAEKKLPVTVVLMENAKELQGDALINFQRLQNGSKTGVTVLPIRTFNHRPRKNYAVIIDAMLGTSFRGRLKGKYLSAVKWCNAQSALRIAVDIPTGLNGETGEAASEAFRADLTVTMSNPKTGLFLGRAKEYTGRVSVAEIGIPKRAITVTNRSLVDAGDVRNSFPRRSVNSHKHSVGKVFVLAGSRSMAGAAYLCSQAAMRSGAGQVILGIPDSEYDVIARRTVEVMPVGLPSTRDGSISRLAIAEIEQRIAWSDVLVIGCGISRNAETQGLVRDLIRNCPKPVVVDADGLNALAGHLGILSARKQRAAVLTPHHGEFSRLSGIPAEKIGKDPMRYASEFAVKHRCVVLLKGAPSVIAAPNGAVYMNPNGNPGMSTAGTGDVLAGIVGSFIGQGNRAAPAAVNAAFIHSSAGDIAAAIIGQYGMTAGDVLKAVPAAIKELMNI